MMQDERLSYLIGALLQERPDGKDIPVPGDAEERWRLLRALMNVKPPAPVPRDVLRVQDDYLQEELRRRGVTAAEGLEPAVATPGGTLCLWQGDITTLDAGAIVNAANNRLLGCFVPGHHCIDNAIHTYAGMQLRLACNEIMEAQGYPEPTGDAKTTPAFNLPSAHVIHTVGPIIAGDVREEDARLLASCYCSCLVAAEEAGCSSLAFCCISTGEFRFPNRLAASIAVEAVKGHLAATGSGMRVVFNVFLDKDRQIYEELLRH